MFNFAVSVAELLSNKNITELYITGEAMCNKYGVISWHPFCYEVSYNVCMSNEISNDENMKTYKLFSLFQETINKNGKNKYNISPPDILFTCILSGGINELYDRMNQKTENFEGCFIVAEDNSCGFKWKTRLFEEQKK